MLSRCPRGGPFRPIQFFCYELISNQLQYGTRAIEFSNYTKLAAWSDVMPLSVGDNWNNITVLHYLVVQWWAWLAVDLKVLGWAAQTRNLEICSQLEPNLDVFCHEIDSDLPPWIIEHVNPLVLHSISLRAYWADYESETIESAPVFALTLVHYNIYQI